MEINIRRATLEDYASICKLLEEIDALHREHLPHIFQDYEGPARPQEYYAGLLADPNMGLFTAQDGEALIGYGHASLREAPDVPLFIPRRYGNINEIVVRSRDQGRGVGRLLIGAMQEWLREQGVKSIELNVYEFNQAAIQFYERLGYRLLSRRMSLELDGDPPPL